jgi:hypothetical protein
MSTSIAVLTLVLAAPLLWAVGSLLIEILTAPLSWAVSALLTAALNEALFWTLGAIIVGTIKLLHLLRRGYWLWGGFGGVLITIAGLIGVLWLTGVR